ncbi:DUF3306 domain-containing protein [Vibrio sp. CK2-1]|uniref:DUF3306 domain-containing protein n=1 Tax=Vibrio sp. CK2-1 TaxID=2912249 RepID=UPI001F1639F8|nr:DUF3306 domain-containing protein [Vibrio sp. CK2-1]MCF7353361.1 DUF3306 domain-containing protein [Vibrio sp. CK2-1]
MATNRFQRWLSKKNESLEESQELDTPRTAQSEDALDSTDAHSNTETILESESESNSTHQQPNELASQHAESEEQATQELPLTTIAHVFADGFSKQEKQQQLRALFHSDEFSGIDPLDSYNMDYTKVKSLPKDVADTLRSWHKRVEEVFDEDEDLEITHVEAEKSELAQDDQASSEMEESELTKVAMDEGNQKSG